MVGQSQFNRNHSTENIWLIKVEGEGSTIPATARAGNGVIPLVVANVSTQSYTTFAVPFST